MSTQERLYSTDHYTWVTVNGDEATVGFSSYSCDRMEEMVALEFKPVGEEVKQSDPCGTVDVMKALIDIPAPITGVILEINDKVIEAPEISREDPFGEGWLIKMRVINPAELETLLSAEEYGARTGK